MRNAIFSLGVFWLLSQLALAQTLSGRVVRVDAGNRLTLIDAQNVLHQVSLQALEVPPPTSVPGSESRSNLERLVSGKYVTVEYGPDSERGPPTGTVYLGEVNINRMQLRAGLARYRRDPGSAEDGNSKQDRQAEKTAIRDGRGFWAPQANGPSEPVLVPIEPPSPIDSTRYPPQPDRKRYRYTPSNGDSKQDSVSVEPDYAPLTGRERTPYGAWALDQEVPP